MYGWFFFIARLGTPVIDFLLVEMTEKKHTITFETINSVISGPSEILTKNESNKNEKKMREYKNFSFLSRRTDRSSRCKDINSNNNPSTTGPGIFDETLFLSLFLYQQTHTHTNYTYLEYLIQGIPSFSLSLFLIFTSSMIFRKC